MSTPTPDQVARAVAAGTAASAAVIAAGQGSGTIAQLLKAAATARDQAYAAALADTSTAAPAAPQQATVVVYGTVTTGKGTAPGAVVGGTYDGSQAQLATIARARAKEAAAAMVQAQDDAVAAVAKAQAQSAQSGPVHGALAVGELTAKQQAQAAAELQALQAIGAAKTADEWITANQDLWHLAWSGHVDSRPTMVTDLDFAEIAPGDGGPKSGSRVYAWGCLGKIAGEEKFILLPIGHSFDFRTGRNDYGPINFRVRVGVDRSVFGVTLQGQWKINTVNECVAERYAFPEDVLLEVLEYVGAVALVLASVVAAAVTGGIGIGLVVGAVAGVGKAIAGDVAAEDARTQAEIAKLVKDTAAAEQLGATTGGTSAPGALAPDMSSSSSSLLVVVALVAATALLGVLVVK